MRARFVEASSPSWSFWRAIADGCIGLIVGTLCAFLGMVIAGVIGDEALSSQYARFDLDAVLRACMGVFLILAPVLGFGVPLLVAAERAALMRAVERLPEGAVPPRRLRLALSESPFVIVRTTGTVLFWCAVVTGAFLAIAAMVVEDLREDVVVWAIVAVFMGATAIGGVLHGIGRSRVGSTDERYRARRAAGESAASRAEARDRRRRAAAPEAVVPGWLVVPRARTVSRIAQILMIATAVALGAFMLSVSMRQQCRICDPVTWSQPIENGIDVLSVASGIGILVCSLLGLLAWVCGLALQGVREIALARWVRETGPCRIDLNIVEPFLVGSRAAVRLQRGLSAAGAILLVVSWGIRWADNTVLDPVQPAAIGAALIVVGLVIGRTDAHRRTRERQAIREALAPGDPAPAVDDTGD